VSLLTNPLVMRAVLLLFGAIVAFGLALFLMRQLRKILVSDSEWTRSGSAGSSHR
jgi:hypothetical protein